MLEALATQKSAAVVPTLWCYEVSAVLARAQLRDFLTPVRVAEFLEDLNILAIRVDMDAHTLY
jgi:hypothetical protein